MPTCDFAFPRNPAIDPSGAPPRTCGQQAEHFYVGDFRNYARCRHHRFAWTPAGMQEIREAEYERLRSPPRPPRDPQLEEAIAKLDHAWAEATQPGYLERPSVWTRLKKPEV